MVLHDISGVVCRITTLRLSPELSELLFDLRGLLHASAGPSPSSGSSHVECLVQKIEKLLQETVSTVLSEHALFRDELAVGLAKQIPLSESVLAALRQFDCAKIQVDLKAHEPPAQPMTDRAAKKAVEMSARMLDHLAVVDLKLAKLTRSLDATYALAGGFSQDEIVLSTAKWT